MALLFEFNFVRLFPFYSPSQYIDTYISLYFQKLIYKVNTEYLE